MAATDRAITLEDGPWDGMLDSIAPTARQEGKYQLGQNIYPLDPNAGDGVVGRPGCRVMGAQLGGVGARRVQGVYQFTKKNGTEYTIAIVGGKFYTLNWTTEVWSEVLTAANLAGAAIVLSATARVAFLTFKDQVIISDGVNTPWAWDGTGGAGLTKLTNAPVIYGQPWTYEGRWMGIKATDPSTFVWSEVDVLNTGFEAGGFNNAWTITQTNPNRLYLGVPANDGIALLRARSATIASGNVGPNFASTATREALDETEGTLSPFAAVRVGSSVFVLNADLQAQLIRPGASTFTPIWTPFRETLKSLRRNPAAAELAIAMLYTPASLILCAVNETSAADPSMLLVFDAKGDVPTPVAIWRGWSITALAMVKSAVIAEAGTPYLFRGDADGYVYLHGNPDSISPWDDQLVGGTVAIEHILQCQALGYSTKREKVFDRIDIAVRALTSMTFDVSAITPRGVGSTQRITVASGIYPPSLSLWDEDDWDVMPWDSESGNTGEEAHGDVGIDVIARWIKPKIRHAELGEQFGLVALTVEAYGHDDDPEDP